MPEKSGMDVVDLKDIVTEALEDDPEVYDVSEDADGDLVVETLDEAQSKFKITVTAL